MFNRVLVANRGEIALRLLRGLRDLRIQGVAMYTQSDSGGVHVREADFAFPLKQPGTAGYLDQTRILEIAKESGCDALLPGYGFLSENAEFAQSCAEAGICFIGPSPEAIRTMGDKIRARELMEKAGVPVVPGGNAATLDDAATTAELVGYPVLLKAAHGGGGKGMRLVHSQGELKSAYALARSESQRAFGSDVVYVEKAILAARHVEIQVLGDLHGNTVHLFERDCSIQRRHQKIVEETPSPGLAAETIGAMTSAALRAVQEVAYYSVGTLEFLVDEDQHFYFLEMNTRLQVEHTVTEMITGIDLVEQMLLVAAGESLSFTQEDISRRGCAMQCRIYAEDPEVGFLPSAGVISQLGVPGGPHVRLDSGICEGFKVTSEFDPLLAKLCVWGKDRPQALRRMARALHEFHLLGPKTNLAFHQRLLEDESFRAGRYNTNFVPDHPGLREPAQSMGPETLMAMAAAVAQAERRPQPQNAGGSNWRNGRRRWKAD